MENDYKIGELYLATEYAGFAEAVRGLDCLAIMYDPTMRMGRDINCWYSRPGELYNEAARAAEDVSVDTDALMRRWAVAVNEKRPEYVCLLDTPAGALLGDNLQSAALELEYLTGVTCCAVDTTGTRYYNQGEIMAYDFMFEKIMDQSLPQDDRTVNILGMTELDFSMARQYDYLKYFVADCGYKVNARIGGGASIEEIRRAPCAELNLVMSMAAVPLAERMRLELGMPYYIASIGTVSGKVKLAECLGADRYEPAEVCGHDGHALIIGEQAAANGMRDELRDVEGYSDVDVAACFEFHRCFAEAGDISALTLQPIINLTQKKRYDTVVADYRFRSLFDDNIHFVPVEYPAVSDKRCRFSADNLLC